jgi:hypothetical protein
MIRCHSTHQAGQMEAIQRVVLVVLNERLLGQREGRSIPFWRLIVPDATSRTFQRPFIIPFLERVMASISFSIAHENPRTIEQCSGRTRTSRRDNTNCPRCFFLLVIRPRGWPSAPWSGGATGDKLTRRRGVLSSGGAAGGP